MIAYWFVQLTCLQLASLIYPENELLSLGVNITPRIVRYDQTIILWRDIFKSTFIKLFYIFHKYRFPIAKFPHYFDSLGCRPWIFIRIIKYLIYFLVNFCLLSWMQISYAGDFL